MSQYNTFVIHDHDAEITMPRLCKDRNEYYSTSCMGILTLLMVECAFGLSEITTDIQRPIKQNILKRILTNYRTSVAPTIGLNPAAVVTVSFAPIAILNLDEANQILTFSACLYLRWIDPALAWNSSEFPKGGRLHVDPGDVWTPQLVIPNGAKQISNIPFQLQLIVTSSGFVIAYVIDIFQTTCAIDITMYPFDTQTCYLSIMSLSGFTLEANEVYNESMFKQYFLVNSEWNVVDITIKQEIPSFKNVSVPLVKVTFILKRHSIFYVVNVIFPITLLSFMNAFVFLLPVESGEKVSYLVSMFVSESVFLNFVNDALPKTSIIPLMTYYMVTILGESFIALLVTLFVLNLHHHPDIGRGWFRKTNSIQSSPVTTEGPADMTGSATSDKPETGKNGSVADDNIRAKVLNKLDLVLFGIFFVTAVASLSWCAPFLG